MLTIIFFTDSKKVRNYFPPQAHAAITYGHHATRRKPLNQRHHHDRRPPLHPCKNPENADADSPPTAEARQSILNQILHPEAADRLGRIRLVKEERAADVENRLIMLARSGQLQQKVTEAQLKDLLAAVSANQEKEKIVVSRRKAWEDDDDDLLDL